MTFTPKGEPIDLRSSMVDQLTGDDLSLLYTRRYRDQIVNRYFHQHTLTETTLASAVPAGGDTYQIDIVEANGFVVGDPIHINTTTVESTHPIVTDVSSPTGAATLTLDRRLDFAHSIGDKVEKVITNIASQNGTIAVPQEYYVEPPPNQVWEVTRFMFEMEHGASGDNSRFGGIPALTNGVLIRAKQSGQYGTLTNWKRNGEIVVDMFDVRYDDRAGGGGIYSTAGRGTFTNTGASLILDGSKGDRLELYVQDTLVGLGLTSFLVKAQGNVKKWL